MTSRSLVVALAALSFSPLAYAGEGEPPKPRKIEAPARPRITEAVAVDYASLPLMVGAPIPLAQEASIRIEPTRQDPNTTPAGPSWTVSPLPKASVVRVGDFVLPPDGDQIHQAPESLLGGQTSVAAEWFVVDESSVNPEGASVRRYTGTFANGAVTAATAEKVRAMAIVPAVLYGFRRCVSGCDKALGDLQHVEAVSLLVPRPLWVSSSEPAPRELGYSAHPLAIVSALIRPGSSASLVIETMGTRRAPVVNGAPSPIKARAYELEMVWPEGGELETTLFIGVIEGTRKKIGGHYSSEG